MAKKRLTPRQKEWETEYKKLKRRVSDWKRKFHAVPDLPIKPERITKKDIERLKQFKWKNISEAEKKQWRREYEYRYENKMPDVYQPKPPYDPPGEDDYYKNPDYIPPTGGDSPWEDEEPDEDGYTETVVSRDEIEAWLDANINTIAIDYEVDGMREKIFRLVLEAADAYGDYGEYLAYLEDNADILNHLAERAMAGHPSGRSGGRIVPDDPAAISEFATVLNLNRPLSQSQSERLQDEGWVSYDFND